MHLLVVAILSSFVLKLFVSLGISLFVHLQLTFLLDNVLGFLSSSVGGLSSDVHDILAIFGFWEAISFIGSTMITVAAIKSMKVAVGIKS